MTNARVGAMEITWAEKYDRDLKKGDILRTRVENKEHERYGQYAYAICSGNGFGCRHNALGNAIFVDHSSFDLERTLAMRGKLGDPNTSDRWERFWPLWVGEMNG
jgi:hypothetical protein